MSPPPTAAPLVVPAVRAALGAIPTLGAAVAAMARQFREAGIETPGLDARRLAAWAIGDGGTALLREPERSLDTSEQARIAGAVIRRLAHEPVSRIVGQRSFHGLDLEIGPATLDPRPETETLVEGVLELVRTGRVPGGTAPRILDLGTGSGAILLALLQGLPEASGLGVDISSDALAVAGRNAERLGLASRAEFRQSHWYAGIDGQFDLVVSNPPYIERAAIADLDPEVARFDPAAALDGGDDGLDAYRAIIGGGPAVLMPGGWLVCEIGVGQLIPLTELLRAAAIGPAGAEFLVWPDLSGIARCVAAKART